jgi:hypothetical protein
VTVWVKLDAQSHAIGYKIYSSPSPLLNDAALASAHAATFQTAVRNCRPVPSDYLYTVSFGS